MVTQLRSFGTRELPKFCVLLIDIDHFKNINDSVGHFVGDRVLVDCATAIRAAFRESETVARWGGEEFMLLLPSERLTSIREIINRVHDGIHAIDFSLLGLSSPVTVSIGAAESRPEESIEDVLNAADGALYRAKANGRNQTEFRSDS